MKNATITAATLAGVALLALTPAEANAEPVSMMHDAALFCRWVDANPTPAGVLNAAAEFAIQGVPKQATIDTIGYALAHLCPEYAGIASVATREGSFAT